MNQIWVAARSVHLFSFDLFGIPQKRYQQSKFGGLMSLVFISFCVFLIAWFIRRFVENDIVISQQLYPYDPSAKVAAPGRLGVIVRFSDVPSYNSRWFDVLFTQVTVLRPQTNGPVARVDRVNLGITNCTYDQEIGQCPSGQASMQGRQGDPIYSYVLIEVRGCDPVSRPGNYCATTPTIDAQFYGVSGQRSVNIYYETYVSTTSTVLDQGYYTFPSEPIPVTRSYEMNFRPKTIKTADRYLFSTHKRTILNFADVRASEENALQTPRTYYSFVVQLAPTWQNELQTPENLISLLRNVGGTISALLIVFAFLPRQYNYRLYLERKRQNHEAVKKRAKFDLLGL
eukprot:TRINITY_DN6369_c0_g1_i1.p2 TRINITY_DN6369_c0_g1~~TRINITY_DN6369_c0_g1_i1.p2  ORF type:complete len:343 (+),score=80.67 TRINITY_DN6369_c0_g1_i1:104-1132(+)